MRTVSGVLVSLSLIALAALAPASLDAQRSAIGVATPQDVGSAAVAQLEPRSLENAFPGLSLPRMVHLTHGGDGSDRLWAVLQHGRIVVFPNDRAATSAQVFLDIEDRVVFGGEQGLLARIHRGRAFG